MRVVQADITRRGLIWTYCIAFIRSKLNLKFNEFYDKWKVRNPNRYFKNMCGIEICASNNNITIYNEDKFQSVFDFVTNQTDAIWIDNQYLLRNISKEQYSTLCIDVLDQINDGILVRFKNKKELCKAILKYGEIPPRKDLSEILSKFDSGQFILLNDSALKNCELDITQLGLYRITTNTTNGTSRYCYASKMYQFGIISPSTFNPGLVKAAINNKFFWMREDYILKIPKEDRDKIKIFSIESDGLNRRIFVENEKEWCKALIKYGITISIHEKKPYIKDFADGDYMLVCEEIHAKLHTFLLSNTKEDIGVKYFNFDSIHTGMRVYIFTRDPDKRDFNFYKRIREITDRKETI